MESINEPQKIEIEGETLRHLNITRKWTMFLSIIGFIFLGILIIFGLIAGTFMSVFKASETGSGIPQLLMVVSAIIMVLAYFFPTLFLFRFSKHMAKAVQTLNKEELGKAFRYLKSYFVFIGVIVIIVLSFYLIALIFAGSSVAFLKGLG